MPFRYNLKHTYHKATKYIFININMHKLRSGVWKGKTSMNLMRVNVMYK